MSGPFIGTATGGLESNAASEGLDRARNLGGKGPDTFSSPVGAAIGGIGGAILGGILGGIAGENYSDLAN